MPLLVMSPEEKMLRVDTLLSHVWMVRTFLKHSDEAQEDEELAEVHRTLYDCMHALGAAANASDAETFLKQAKKKLGKLKQAAELFEEIQPEISSHTNFQMARQSLTAAIGEIATLLE
ncbi:MAG: amidohydrolase [Pirellulaceae bacterium]